jgi:hypothetical protein
MRHTQDIIRALVAGIGMTLMCTAPALGGSIANLIVTDLSQPDMFLNTSAFSQERRSSATLVSSNTAAVIPTFSARLAGLAVADSDALGAARSTSLILSMQIDFDIVAAPAESWTMQLDQLRRFALTLRDDATNAHASQASVNQRSGSFNFTPGLSGSVPIPTAGSENTGSVSGDLYLPANVNNTNFMNGVGPTSVQLNFSQLLTANSYDSTFFTTGQEAAVRFGIAGSLSGVIVDDYPGIGGRSVSNDGHFVDVKLTFVPEPASAALMTLGLAPFLLRKLH